MSFLGFHLESRKGVAVFTCVVGTLLLGAIVVCGIFIYFKVEMLDREIAKQRQSAPLDPGENDG